MKASDPEIRHAFSLFYKRAVPTALLKHEFHVNDGRAIADIVTLSKYAHCFEIKSDLDKLERVSAQSESYDSAFRRITLITTANKVQKALSILPDHWGLLVYEPKVPSAFKYIRKSTNSPYFQSKIALKSLWREELLSLLQDLPENKNKLRINREGLISILAGTYSESKIAELISDSVKNRVKVI